MAREESSTGDDVLGGRMKLIASKVDSKIYFFKDAMMEYMDMKHIIGDLAEEKARMEREAFMSLAGAPQDLAAAKEELAATAEELAARKKELDAAKHELAATKEELGVVREEVAATKKQLEVVKEQLKAFTVATETEAMRNLDEQQSMSVTDSVQCQPSLKLTGYIPGHETLLKGVVSGNALKAQQVTCHCAISIKEFEVLRGTLIKEFMQFDCCGRVLGVKEMGRLNRKAFDVACAAKLPAKEAEKKACKLYTAWEKLLKNPSWKPFKTVVAVEDDHHQEEVIDVDDDKLQELKRAWGEGPHDAVVSALMEMREYKCLSKRTITYDLWNYKAGRKATMMECVEYMGNQVRQLSAVRRRKTRRTAGMA